MNNFKRAEFLSGKAACNPEHAKRLVVSSTHSKGLKQSCAARFAAKVRVAERKQGEAQHRSKSKAEQFEELLGGKLAEMYQVNYRDKNNFTPSFISDSSVMGDYKGMHTSLYETVDRGKLQKRKKRVRPSSLMRASKMRKNKQGKNCEKEYCTQNKFNAENSGHAILLDNRLVRGDKVLKSTTNTDEKKLIVTANNSYIHNLNIAPDGFGCSDAAKGYSKSFISSIDAFLDNKALKSPIESIELELNKKILEAERYDEAKRQSEMLKAHNDVLASLSTACPCLEHLLTRVKRAYSEYLAFAHEQHEKELRELKESLSGRGDEGLERKREGRGKVPRLDLSRVRRSSDEEAESAQKVKVPLLKLDNLRKDKEYHEEFMDKADEFSLSWKEQLKKEKRC